MLCDNALLIAYAEGNRKIQAGHLKEAIQDSRVRDRRNWRVPKVWASKSYTSSSLPLMIVVIAFIVLIFSAAKNAREGSDTLPSSAVATPEIEQLDSRASEAPSLTLPPEEETLPAETTLSPGDLPVAPRQNLPGSFSLPHRVERRQWFREMLDQMPLDEVASTVITVPYQIQEGDNFGKIVETTYTLKDPRYQALLKALNPHIEDFNLLRPGWSINIPLMEVTP
jgi:nucleoid-associated protein YgaU